MAYYIYSTEALPNPEMMGKAGYTPDSEYVRWGGVCLPPIPKKKWMQLDDSYPTLMHRDWRDRAGTEVDIPIRRFKGIIDHRFASRGVIFIDHEPSPVEKEILEKKSEELNMAFRMECIRFYEDQVREKEVTGHGRTKPTPYEDECYDMLGMKKPYDPKTIQALRDPGATAAKEIAEAIKQGQAATSKAVAEAIAEVLTRPTEPREHVRK